jgi:hypothetical protein
MNNEYEKQSRSIADSSGFPLQLKIGEVVNSSGKWRVFLEEYPWESQETKTNGFIDLVINDRVNVQCMVLECKRVRQAAWVFLVPLLDPEPRTHARLWCSSYNGTKWILFGWQDYQTSPASYESKFCAILGHEHGRRTLLERTAAELVESVEALAIQEKQLEDNRNNTGLSFGRIYVPVLVTTAELRVGLFDPKSISLTDGSLPTEATFKTVPYVRFRKSLTSRVISTAHSSLQETYESTERTIFVVNAESFQVFLQEWGIN